MRAGNKDRQRKGKMEDKRNIQKSGYTKRERERERERERQIGKERWREKEK